MASLILVNKNIYPFDVMMLWLKSILGQVSEMLNIVIPCGNDNIPILL